MTPLAKLASDYRLAVVCITHLNKSPSDDPFIRVMGSGAFAAMARAAFLVERDKMNPDRRLFLQFKGNLSAGRHGHAYRIERHILLHDIETSRVVWEPGPVVITPSDALAPSSRDDLDEAKDVIEASQEIFNAQTVSELPSSQLIARLRERVTLPPPFNPG